MSKILSIPLGVLPMVFKKIGFTPGEMTTLIGMLLMLCRHNEHRHLEELLSEFIRTEMDLDPLHAQIFILESLPCLLDIGKSFREVCLTGSLIRYNVIGYSILLEVDNDY
jgi:hypothetical protein